MRGRVSRKEIVIEVQIAKRFFQRKKYREQEKRAGAKKLYIKRVDRASRFKDHTIENLIEEGRESERYREKTKKDIQREVDIQREIDRQSELQREGSRKRFYAVKRVRASKRPYSAQALSTLSHVPARPILCTLHASLPSFSSLCTHLF